MIQYDTMQYNMIQYNTSDCIILYCPIWEQNTRYRFYALFAFLAKCRKRLKNQRLHGFCWVKDTTKYCVLMCVYVWTYPRPPKHPVPIFSTYRFLNETIPDAMKTPVKKRQDIRQIQTTISDYRPNYGWISRQYGA